MRRREIFIELTSLLDVILIMLFVLLTQAKTQTGEALESAEAARIEAQSAQAERDALLDEREALVERADSYRRQAITVGVVEENSLVLTISVTDSGGRSIRIEPREGGEIRIPVESGEGNYTLNRLRSTLSGLVRDSGKETVFIVFQYDRTAIYQSEYTLIGSVVRELKDEARSADVALNYIETDIRTEG